jgi:hypothetical protein
MGIFCYYLRMKQLITLITILFISLLSLPSWSETKNDLVKRDGFYYKKFTDVPFTGKVTGTENGMIKNGNREGLWRFYWDDGQLERKGNYKDGKTDGLWEFYREDGQLKSKGDYKNFKKEGPWEFYKEDGSVWTELTGTYKNGVKISD